MPKRALQGVCDAATGLEFDGSMGGDGWFGVNCDPLGNVVELELPENNLNGPFPVPVVLLESLKSLWLENNNLEGPLPADLFPEMNLKTTFVDPTKDIATPVRFGVHTRDKCENDHDCSFQGLDPLQSRRAWCAPSAAGLSSLQDAVFFLSLFGRLVPSAAQIEQADS